MLVDFVVPDSPAAEAGLVEGDVVVAIDDQPIHARTLLDLRPRLRREGERVTVTVLRDGTRRAITLVTRRLV
jgi:S1-C subfamily serine protease